MNLLIGCFSIFCFVTMNIFIKSSTVTSNTGIEMCLLLIAAAICFKE